MGSLGFELAPKDYLLAVRFLVLLSSETGFVIQISKVKFIVFIVVIWNRSKYFYNKF